MVVLEILADNDTWPTEEEISISSHIMRVGGRAPNPLAVPHIVKLQGFNPEQSEILLDVWCIKKYPLWPCWAFMNCTKGWRVVVL